MFWFKKPEKKEIWDENWRESMLLRWKDLEARVALLEMADKEYKKRVRTTFKPQEEENLSKGMLIPE
jgi:hypothetical protein